MTPVGTSRCRPCGSGNKVIREINNAKIKFKVGDNVRISIERLKTLYTILTQRLRTLKIHKDPTAFTKTTIIGNTILKTNLR